jgi:phosphoribosylanthranilate isomerase
LNIKICGIASQREAETAVAEGADLLGFIFMRGPRRVEPRLVRDIVRSLPGTTITVGVFRNQPLDEVRSILLESSVGAAQLNGTEPPEFAAAVGAPVIKSFPTYTRRSLEEWSRFDSFACLADPGARGAVDPDWSVCAKKFGRVLIAAPADFEALHALIHRVRPWGVDASGVHDPERLRALVETVRAADYDTQKIRVTIR